MARKTLLTESELRRFMKLADMRPAGEKRIQEMGARYPGARDEDEELEDELGHEDDIAGDEAGDRGGAVRGGVHAQFLAAGRPGRAVDVGEDRTRSGGDGSGTNRPDVGDPGEVEHEAARQRHGLAVVARSGATHRDRHAVAMAGRQHPGDLLVGGGRRHDVGRHVVELALEHRRVPEEIAALLLHGRRVALDGNAAQIRNEAVEIHHPLPPGAASDQRERPAAARNRSLSTSSSSR